MDNVVIKPPQAHRTLFLVGSIEQGKAVDWQTELTNRIDEWVILNPRRDDWDTSLEQSINEPVFRHQVEWELSGIEKADLVVCYFDQDTMSPITLLELGLLSQRKPGQTIVCCPDGFWRKGNVDIVCHRYGIRQVNDLEALIAAINAMDKPTEADLEAARQASLRAQFGTLGALEHITFT